jgi:hypothetical protein
VNEEFERTYEWSWFILKYHPYNCVEAIRKTMEVLVWRADLQAKIQTWDHLTAMFDLLIISTLCFVYFYVFLCMLNS